MKTTVEIEDHLLRHAKKIAVDRGWTLRQMIESGLRREIVILPSGPRRMLSRPTATGSLPAGLDLSNREKMWEWLESEEKNPGSA